MDVTKWRAVCFTGPKSCLPVPPWWCVCHMPISDHKEEINRTNKTDRECTKLLVVKFICKINESLSWSLGCLTSHGRYGLLPVLNSGLIDSLGSQFFLHILFPAEGMVEWGSPAEIQRLICLAFTVGSTWKLLLSISPCKSLSVFLQLQDFASKDALLRCLVFL